MAAAAAAETEAAAAETETYRSGGDRRRNVKILTPSFRDANIKTYKIYSPSEKPSSSSFASLEEEEECIATEALVELQNVCLNPMRPITQYMYCINVYNSDRTLHYRSAYITYDNTTRMYHVYSIISNCFPDAVSTAAATATAASGYPAPMNTVQMKYTTYINESVVNYIMTMIVPSNEYDYFIQDDIVGIVVPKEEFAQAAFDPESSYYDIDNIFNDNTSRETLYGFKAFQLIPSRKYWRDPTSAIGPSYTESVINSALLIL